MLLRSGNIYDSSYEYRKKDFMRFDNILFASIWDECRDIYIAYLDGDYFNANKIRKGCKLFSKSLLSKIEQVIGKNP